MPLIYQKWILRSDLRSNPDKFYVFGDNVQKTGLRGQAASMRGEPNAIGIPTKWFPSMSRDAFFYDSQIDQITPHLNADYQPVVDALAAGKTVIWPTDNIGTGLSRLPTNAPLLWAKMQSVRAHLETL